MCNFLGHRVTKIEFIRLINIEKELGTLAAMKELGVLKDGFKYGNIPVVRKCSDNDIEVVPMHWEFIPIWIKNMEEVKAARKQGIPWLNATAEKLLTSKMFRSAALKRRCLVIASDFYEWEHYKPEGAKKPAAYPYAVSVKDADYFYMAGIWQTWTDKTTGETMDTVAIVTTTAKGNTLMERVHNTKMRMPTILTNELAWEWIMDDLSEERIQEIASFQFPANKMAAYTIKKEFKQLENPLEAFVYPELSPLELAV
jgi:putative SOS response-associated peptidase YedK